MLKMLSFEIKSDIIFLVIYCNDTIGGKCSIDEIRLEFENELRNKMLLAKKECQYNPTYFNQMLAEIGGVATAKRLIEKALATGNPSDGFTTLLLKGRLDLTMEASVCNPVYKDLFEQYEIDYCQKILGR